MSGINRRQFIIMKTPYVNSDFLSVKMSNDLFLSYHKDLKVQKIGNNIILGWVFSCTEDDIMITNNIYEDMRTWAGRWILITEDFLYMDASGTLGIFYVDDKSHERIYSSSLNLISEVGDNVQWYANYIVKRCDIKMLDYYPGPYTPIKNVKALLPSQYIDLKNGQICDRKDFNFNVFKHLSKEELINRVIKLESNVLKNIKKEFGDEIWLPLTAGVDSRSILAVAKKCDVELNIYTIIRDDIEPCDRKIPQKLAHAVNAKYYQFKDKYVINDETKKRRDEITKHCGGRTTDDTGVAQYLSGIDVPIKRQAIILWGPLWEFGIHYYESYFSKLQPLESEKDIVNAFNIVTHGALEKSNIHRESIKEWVKHVHEKPIEGLNWMDRLYWEQRISAWVKYAHQLLDMLDSVRVIPVNCQMILELLIGFDREYNTTKKEAQVDLIKACCVELSKIPYGAPNFVGYRLYRAAVKRVKKVVFKSMLNKPL